MDDPTVIGNVSLLTGQSMTSSVGSAIATYYVVPTGQSATSSVGSIAPADVMGVTGLSSTIRFRWNHQQLQIL